MKKPIIIAFSGGCFSGKTSTIEALKKFFDTKSTQVIVLSELLRKVTKLPISEMRKYQNSYFEFEKKIISEKINQEENVKKQLYQDCVVLVDRALTDSLFYYENYINTNEFVSQKALESYYKFHKYLISKVIEHFKYVYNLVIEFKPLNASYNESKYRPNDVRLSNKYEYECIKRLNFYYSINTGTKFLYADLSSSNSNDLIHTILKAINYEKTI